MASCPFADSLEKAHIACLQHVRANNTWDRAMEKKAATDAAWEAVCQHRFYCPLCKGRPQSSNFIN